MYDDTSGQWDVMESHSLDTASLSWGLEGALPVVGDFDGDGCFDPAFFDPSTGNWFIRKFFEDTVLASELPWGSNDAVPVPADYTGDGRDDIAVYFESAGLWYVRTIDGDTVLWEGEWGGTGMVAVPGDYTGDGRADLAVFSELTGRWFIRTVDGEVVLWEHEWGGPRAIPVPGDYTGNGRADLALFQPSTGEWFVQEVDGVTLHEGTQWGTSVMIPVSGDFDGDGRNDLTLYDPTTRNWYVKDIFWEHAWGEEGQLPAMGVRSRPRWGGTYEVGDIVPIHLDYSRHWTLTLRGDFVANSHGRFIQTGHDLRQGLDLFRWDGSYALRLFDRSIVFTSATLGSISTPAPPDHWAMTVHMAGTASHSGEMKIEYDPLGGTRMYRDGALIGDWTFRIDDMPPVRKELWLLGFSGEVILE